jgi:hypothetical protein
MNLIKTPRPKGRDRFCRRCGCVTRWFQLPVPWWLGGGSTYECLECGAGGR